MPVLTGGNVLPSASADPDSIDSRGAKCIRARYSFAADGGAQGTIALLPGTPIPNNAIIIDSGVEVVTIPTSGGSATIAVTVNAANDIVNAAAISGAPWSTTGRKAGIPLAFATSVKTTAARTVSIVIGTADLTAGVFDVWLWYVEGS